MAILESSSWQAPPPVWSIDPSGEILTLETAPFTDFWQRPQNNVSADNGHFFHCGVQGDFTLTAHVAFRPAHQYDQAGLMVRISPTCWLKTSVENEPGGHAMLGVVVTNHGYSDWSTQAFPGGPGQVWLRVRRRGGDYTVESSADGSDWTQIRLSHLLEESTGLEAGLYACSPKGAGFSATFSKISLER